MQPTRTRLLSIALAAFALLLSACSSDASKASVVISKFRVECPAQLNSTFSADPTFSSLGDRFVTNLSSDTCSCIATRLRALPPEKVLEFDRSKSAAELETLMSPCSAIAVKSHIGELCMAAVKQLGGDPSVARARCDCVQRETNAMDDATLESTFGNLQQGFTSVARRCTSAG